MNLKERNVPSAKIYIPLKIWRKGKKLVNSLEERKLCCTFAIESNTNVIQSNTERWRRQ